MTHPHSVSLLRSFVCALFAVLSLVHAAFGQSLPYLFESAAGSGPPTKIVWQTEPGVRYDLWQSDDLSGWSRVTGYPAAADGLAMEHAFTPGPRGFFKFLPIDEQAPVVKTQYPAADGFAVGRFADLSIELADATGIDPASIRLTVGAVGPLAVGAPGLTISGNTLTYDSGDAALGAWGATVTATLVAADTLGNSLTHTWSFRLEPEPQTAANIFVFGSPTAQRSGQRVSGPTAALAARFPAPVGPQKANDPPPWSIESVLADRIVIAYEVGGMPTFTAGQLICNLAPRKESEIFYRRVLSVSDDINYYYHPTYAVNGYPYTSPVGSFAPNGYGLYDTPGPVGSLFGFVLRASPSVLASAPVSVRCLSNAIRHPGAPKPRINRTSNASGDATLPEGVSSKSMGVRSRILASNFASRLASTRLATSRSPSSTKPAPNLHATTAHNSSKRQPSGPSHASLRWTLFMTCSA